MCICVYVHKSVRALGGRKRASDHWAELQAVLSHSALGLWCELCPRQGQYTFYPLSCFSSPCWPLWLISVFQCWGLDQESQAHCVSVAPASHTSNPQLLLVSSLQSLLWGTFLSYGWGKKSQGWFWGQVSKETSHWEIYKTVPMNKWEYQPHFHLPSITDHIWAIFWAHYFELANHIIWMGAEILPITVLMGNDFQTTT